MKDKTRRPSKKNSKKENRKYPYKKIRKQIKSKSVGLFVGLFIGVIVGGLLTSLLIGYTIVTPLFGQKLSLDNSLKVNIFTTVSNSWQYDKVVEDLSYLCSLKNDSLKEAYCVYDFINRNAELGEHTNGYSNKLNLPEEIFTKPSLCRDVSVLFKSTMDVMGIENEYVMVPQHIYNKVYIDDKICLVDIIEEKFDCEKIK